MKEPLPGEIYQHFKGEDKKYKIIAIAIDCDNREKKVVVYEQLYGGNGFPIGQRWTRALEDFVGFKIFDKDEQIGEKLFKKGERVKRFCLIENVGDKQVVD